MEFETKIQLWKEYGNLSEYHIVIVIIVIIFTPFKVIMDGWRMPPPLPLGYIKENTKGKLNMANPDCVLINN